MLQKGFTLIELMIVVAIIGILSMFALPAYQDYTKRTYVSEGMALASAAKMAVTETYAAQGVWPSKNDAAGLPSPSKITGQSVLGIDLVEAKGYSHSTDTTIDTTSAATNIKIHYNQKVTGTTGASTFAAANSKNVLTLAPVLYSSENQGSVKWSCESVGSDIVNKWLPANCRNEIS